MSELSTIGVSCWSKCSNCRVVEKIALLQIYTDITNDEFQRHLNSSYEKQSEFGISVNGNLSFK